MKEFFDATFFISNRHKLIDAINSDDPIIMTANGLLQRSADSTYQFRQDSNFWYVTGLDEPDILLVMNGSDHFLVVPSRSSSREAFDGAIDTKYLTNTSGVPTVVDEVEGWRRIESILNKTSKVATLNSAPAYIDTYGMYVNPARAKLIERLKKYNNKLDIIDLREAFVQLRMIKQPQEIAAIQAAIDLTIEAFGFVKKNISMYSYEYELEAEFGKRFRQAGSQHGYTPIVASGKNACTLHYIANNSQINNKELLLLDVGAEVSYYSADITRTYTVQKPSKRQRQIHEAVIDVQRYALSILKPGIMLIDYEKKIEKYMGKTLKQLGLIADINTENIRAYYPHATSHFLGLDVHDVGDYERPLEPGMVLTVEPGIYIPEEAIGVRIEDDVLVTETGIKILSQKLSSDL